MSTKLDPWVEGYLDYLKDVRRLHPGSLRDFRYTLKKFTNFMCVHRPDRVVYKATLKDIVTWLNAERERGQKESCVAKDLSHLRGMLEYAWRSGRTDRNVLDGFSVKPGRALVAPSVLTIDEATRLVQACPSHTAEQRRERMMILLLYGCGLRTGELAALDLNDVDWERHEIFIRRAKGDRQRTVPVPAGLWTELLAYLAEEGRKRGPLFRTHTKRVRFNTRGICVVVTAATARAGIAKKVTPRTLRHSFATHLMERGVDIGVISSLMGHRSPSETGVYLHALSPARRNAVSALKGEKS